jgi:hypothetical protein
MSGVAARHRVLGATAAALAGAVLLLVTVVLPAEHGIDPLGTGAALGLVGLAAEPQGVVRDAADPPRSVRLTFELEPFESFELKFHLMRDAVLVYSWRADGALIAELHGEPDAGPSGRAEAFQATRGSARHGSLRAPFTGWHGWYWENRSGSAVRLDVETHGFTSGVREYRGGRISERSLVEGPP